MIKMDVTVLYLKLTWSGDLRYKISLIVSVIVKPHSSVFTLPKFSSADDINYPIIKQAKRGKTYIFLFNESLFHTLITLTNVRAFPLFWRYLFRQQSTVFDAAICILYTYTHALVLFKLGARNMICVISETVKSRCLSS